MNTKAQPLRIGFIGLGIMGRSMAGHLLAAGHELRVYNRSRDKADDLVARGARWCDSPGEVAAGSEIVVTMVGYPADVENIYLGAGGIVERAAAGTLLVDMTTSSPSLARRIAQAARERGCGALDAPVSGGDVGAREARLSIMVGGEAADFERAQPVLALMGTNIVRMGGPGTGQHTKMCNQIVIASTIVGVTEGLVYAQRSGLDPSTVLQAIGGGAASGFQLNVLGARIVAGDFAPGFFIEHFLKDLGIALGEAEQMGLDLPGLALARGLYQRMAERGLGRDGTQALIKLYQG
ncbi:MAG: NAD(P)-dependent oxidoreductase [Betaproteobacteria bacterium]|uniref:NAD(P)-dependent oxidoreductase n=1 Tax=Thiomonas sp. FB-6 TaxID=1158291 RepID=UPI00037D9414|nr:NAD(P)-dependent oxidoreductase [Thiomonas sp. FB-6]MBU6441477.1 NAD(P)-dependent oxidoreductase [Betaproteobacteria bacterium]MBU6512484.1 NAD(P)-dependent oxidoreductase [Betaproteobacteria bacterium]MDE1954702.1 NAD(P)-dependent oxidoreductase [Betaproteobacteria bacterium]MDE2152698.1 NAD(P)-dependent oxidoreductase [Betaproteobacteria bacterium]